MIIEKCNKCKHRKLKYLVIPYCLENPKWFAKNNFRCGEFVHKNGP